MERLKLAVGEPCALQADWPNAVASGVNAALEFAAADRRAAELLTDDALARWREGEPAFVGMVEHFAGLLGRGAPPHNPRLSTAQTVVTRIARQVNLQLEVGGRGMMAIAPDLTFLALMPYLGVSGARHWFHATAAA